MSQFWAKFEDIDEDTFRFDTRIYLHNVEAPKEGDICIGAIVGKNPGSAKSSVNNSELQPINLDGDKLLPTVRNIVTKAYEQAQTPLPERGFVQVLNLFYLCNPDLEAAITSFEQSNGSKNCSSENGHFPWVWYVWGGKSDKLSPFKKRFAAINTANHFYFDKERSCIVNKLASANVFAKHTQGLKHEYVVPYIAQLVKNS